MTQLQIEYFLLLAQELSISKVARLLYVSQPAVSKQLGLLEKDLGVVLCKRTTKGIELTKAGKVFADLFAEFKLKLKEACIEAQAEQEVYGGDFIIGGPEGWDVSLFYPSLKNVLAEKYPLVNFNLIGYRIEELAQMVMSRQVDCAIGPAALFERSSFLDIDIIAQIPLRLFYSRCHVEGDKDALSFMDFRDSIFYQSTGQSLEPIEAELNELFAKYDINPKVEYVPTLAAVYFKLQLGGGVFLGNDWMMIKNSDSFSSIQLPFFRKVCIATRSNHSNERTENIKQDIINFFVSHFD